MNWFLYRFNVDSLNVFFLFAVLLSACPSFHSGLIAFFAIEYKKKRKIIEIGRTSHNNVWPNDKTKCALRPLRTNQEWSAMLRIRCTEYGVWKKTINYCTSVVFAHLRDVWKRAKHRLRPFNERFYIYFYFYFCSFFLTLVSISHFHRSPSLSSVVVGYRRSSSRVKMINVIQLFLFPCTAP